MRTAFLAVALFALSSSVLAHSAVPVEPGDAYTDARATLISEGWKPRDFSNLDKGERCGFREECDLYPETEACSGAGLGYCAIVFRSPEGEDFVITTTGEELTVDNVRLPFGAWKY